MDPTEHEYEVIRRIFDFDEHGTNRMFNDVMENPVSKYTDPDHLQRELELPSRQLPIAIADRSQPAQPDDFLTRGETGVPVVVAIGEGIQQGLTTGANQHFTFGGYECGLHLGQPSSMPHWPAN
tara:strand:+ start:748 stop:1119 length:372 start_codon:yes stop_codon:yes gene_type:complete